MNNAENYATVEVKRKIAKEEARYDIMEKGETAEVRRDGKRDMGKPDKPDEKEKDELRVADNITSLPPEDFKNVALLMVLCIRSAMVKVDSRSVTRSTRWTGVREYPVPVKGKVKLRTSGNIQSGVISVFDEVIMESYRRRNLL